MFVFGHIGIGQKLAGPWIRHLPRVPLIVGMLLPDLIDKPLYHARISEFISCTRTFGHTGLLLALIAAVAYLARSRGLAALGLGVATHLLLDCVLDLFSPRGPRSAWIALTWPFLHRNFAHYSFASVWSHLEGLWSGPVVTAEIVGLALLGWDFWRGRRRRQLSS